MTPEAIIASLTQGAEVFSPLAEREKLGKVTILTPQSSELEQVLAETINRIGVSADIVTRLSPRDDSDKIVVVGPMTSFSDQIDSLHNLRKRLPPVTVWFTEQVPNVPFARELSDFRYLINHIPTVTSLPGNRFRRIGELLTLQRMTHDLTVHSFSDTNTRFMKNIGIENAFTTPWGYYPELGSTQSLERDIDVIFIGNMRRPRGPVVERLRDKLRERGTNIEIHDGGAHGIALYGAERTTALNKTKIMLAIPQRSWNDIHFRPLLAGANGCLTISTPLIPSSRGPFTPDEDFVAGDLEVIPDLVRHFLDNPSELQRIALNCHQKVVNLSMEKQTRKVLGLPES